MKSTTLHLPDSGLLLDGDLIITAASERYSSQVLALIGSLNCNWPSHPGIIVYDIGLAARTIGVFERAGICVRKVPAF